MRIPTLFLGVVSFGSLLTVASAGPNDVQVSGSRQSAESIEDLGLIEESGGTVDQRVKFRANVSMRSDYTSNALLTGNHGSGDVLWLPGLELGVNVQLGNGFGLDFGARVESVLYSRYDERAFIGYSGTATLDWRPRANLPRVYISAEPYRYDSFDTGDLVTEAIGLTAGTDWGFAFNRGNSLALIGYQFTNYYADPDIDSRAAHRAIAGLVHQFRPQLYGQLLYAYQYNDYREVARSDHRHILSLNFIYQFNRHLFGTLAGTFVDNDSTQDRASYQSAGASLGLSYQF